MSADHAEKPGTGHDFQAIVSSKSWSVPGFLCTRGHKVIDVALEHGYSSQSAFTAMFKQHFGCTPGAFYRGAAR